MAIYADGRIFIIMPKSPKGFIYLSLGFLIGAVMLYTFVNPSFCETGCGNLTKPVFAFLYTTIGPWGPRVLLFLAAIFFFWAAATTRE